MLCAALVLQKVRRAESLASSGLLLLALTFFVLQVTFHEYLQASTRCIDDIAQRGADDELPVVRSNLYDDAAAASRSAAAKC